MKVNQEAMRLWVQALRSGDYEQTKGNLKVINKQTGQASYCCLGVACEVFLKAVGQMVTINDDEVGTDRVLVSFDGNPSVLPDKVVTWLGVPNDNPLISTSNERLRQPSVSAIQANDSRGWDFNQIADALEKMYLPGE